MIIIRIVVFILGLAITTGALRSAVRTLVLSRGVRDGVTSIVFLITRRLFRLRLRWTQDYFARDRVMVYYPSVSLLLLPPTWLALILIGFMGMFWASGIFSWTEAFTVSGSSLLTLGFAKGDTLFQTILAFVEATIGLIMVALLIAYLPAMHAAYAQRETAVALLEARAGNPPSALEMLFRYHRNQGLEALHESWKAWELWFAEIEESHTSLAALVFFRSSRPDFSWVTAAGTVLDAAALSLSVLEKPWDAQAALCIRSGYLALRRIADFYQIAYDPNPSFPEHPISIAREEFYDAYDQLVAAGLPMKPDRDQAWNDFAGWRVNYDTPLLGLCTLTMAPPALWSSDRA